MRLKILVTIIMLFIGAMGYAQEEGQKVEIPFEPREIVEKLSQRFPPSEQTEFLIDTNVVYSPSGWDQQYVDIAFDGINYLVVWQEYRVGVWDICGVRVTPSGTVLDSAGIVISTAANNQQYPVVACAGTNYLVVWQDSRNSTDDIYGARILLDGTILDPNGIAISQAASHQNTPCIAFDGTNYFVGWADYRSGLSNCNIYGARVTPAGTILDPSGIAISTASGHQTWPAIAFGGTNYLLAWQDFRPGSYSDLYGARVTTAGMVLDPSGIAISAVANNEGEASVAYDGTNFFVTWTDRRSGNNIYGARVDASGTVLDPSGIAIAATGGNEMYSDVTFDGTNYFVVWQVGVSNIEIYGTRVSTAGTVLDPSGKAISTAQYNQEYPAIAFDGTNYFVVWQDDRYSVNWAGTQRDIYGSRVSTAGTALDPNGILITSSANHQHWPAIAFDGINFFVVWQDNQNTHWDIYGARVDTLGNVLDANSIAISTAVNNQTYPKVAFDGTNYLVVWMDYRNDVSGDIYGARVSTAGTVLDPSGIAIRAASNIQIWHDVAFDGTNYFVVWQSWESDFHFHIYGARVSTAGTVLDPSPIAISPSATYHQYPAVAFDGTNYLVVWRLGSEGSYACDIYGARVTPGGVILDPGYVAISTATNNQLVPDVAFAGTNYMVVWGDLRNGNNDIYGARVTPAGTVLDPTGIAISTATNNQQYPSIASAESNYSVVWQDYRGGTEWNVYGAKIDFSGVITAQVLISSIGNGDRIWPAVAAGVDSQTLITYSGFVDDINGERKPANTMRILGKFYADGLIGVCEDVYESKTRPGLCVYPNPFSDKVSIVLNAEGKEKATLGTMALAPCLKIYDVSGRLVKNYNLPTLYGLRPTLISWDGTDAKGCKLPSGIYFLYAIGNKGSFGIKKIVKLQ